MLSPMNHADQKAKMPSLEARKRTHRLLFELLLVVGLFLGLYNVDFICGPVLEKENSINQISIQMVTDFPITQAPPAKMMKGPERRPRKERILDEFEVAMEADEPYIFGMFYSPSCVWSKRAMPVWTNFSHEVQHQNIPVKVVKVDCKKSQIKCMLEYNVPGYPTLRWYEKKEDEKEGKYSSVDYKDERTVEALIQFAKNKTPPVENAAIAEHLNHGMGDDDDEKMVSK